MIALAPRLAQIAVMAGAWLSLAPVSGGGQAPAPEARETLVRVATRHLPRGTVLTESDMTVARVTVRRAFSPASPPETAQPGWITRRVIRPGEALQPPAVRRPPLIATGQTVQFIVVTDDIALSMPGTALANADAGEDILVRLDGRRRLHGVVTGPARVVARPSRTTS